MKGMRITEEIRHWMKETGHTVKSISLTTGFSDDSIREYVSGKINPPKQRIIAIAEVFEITIDQFLGNRIEEFHDLSGYGNKDTVKVTKERIARTLKIIGEDYLTNGEIVWHDRSRQGCIHAKRLGGKEITQNTSFGGGCPQ